MSESTVQKHNFDADVKQVLDIVVNALYTDKEVFIRELVSNASDALEKIRHTQLQESEVFDDSLELEVNIQTDDTANTLTIQDFGIGMDENDLTENLGTIDEMLCPEPLRTVGDRIPVPDKPGLGIEINEDALANHTFQMSEAPHLKRLDGSHTNW